MSGYRVTISDAFQLSNPGSGSDHGTFGTATEATISAEALVEASLRQLHRPGMTADDLLQNYFAVGRDPVVVPPPGAAPVAFSAWDYAAERATAMCKESLDDLLSR